MVVNIVVPKRLLDHQQIELVEFAQVLDLIQRIGGIRIATQDDVRPARANLFENIDIPSRLHLDLDASVTGSQFRLDLFQQLFDRILDADGNTALDLTAGPAQQLP